MGEEKLGQGKEGAREYLKAHPELANQIEVLLRAKTNLRPGAEVLTPEIELSEAE